MLHPDLAGLDHMLDERPVLRIGDLVLIKQEGRHVDKMDGKGAVGPRCVHIAHQKEAARDVDHIIRNIQPRRWLALALIRLIVRIGYRLHQIQDIGEIHPRHHLIKIRLLAAFHGHDLLLPEPHEGSNLLSRLEMVAVLDQRLHTILGQLRKGAGSRPAPIHQIAMLGLQLLALLEAAALPQLHQILAIDIELPASRRDRRIPQAIDLLLALTDPVHLIHKGDADLLDRRIVRGPLAPLQVLEKEPYAVPVGLEGKAVLRVELALQQQLAECIRHIALPLGDDIGPLERACSGHATAGNPQRQLRLIALGSHRHARIDTASLQLDGRTACTGRQERLGSGRQFATLESLSRNCRHDHQRQEHTSTPTHHADLHQKS